MGMCDSSGCNCDWALQRAVGIQWSGGGEFNVKLMPFMWRRGLMIPLIALLDLKIQAALRRVLRKVVFRQNLATKYFNYLLLVTGVDGTFYELVLSQITNQSSLRYNVSDIYRGSIPLKCRYSFLNMPSLTTISGSVSR